MSVKTKVAFQNLTLFLVLPPVITKSLVLWKQADELTSAARVTSRPAAVPRPHKGCEAA